MFVRSYRIIGCVEWEVFQVSFEAMETLAAAEETVRRMLADASAEAKQRIADARSAGERTVADALKNAENELAELNRQADAKAKADVLELAGSNENRKAALQARADARADQAAAFIVERIVNS